MLTVTFDSLNIGQQFYTLDGIFAKMPEVKAFPFSCEDCQNDIVNAHKIIGYPKNHHFCPTDQVTIPS